MRRKRRVIRQMMIIERWKDHSFTLEHH